MVSLSSLIESGAQIPQNVSQLQHYNTNEGKDLPADAAPIGVLADGDIYYNAYDMLTPSDISFLKQATGQSFDPATIAAEQAAGTFQGNPLAAAIGSARVDSIMGWGGLSGNVTASYLQLIENAIRSTGMYEGFQISQSELTQAFSCLGSQSNSTMNVSA